jgi:hypothetical protein
MIRIFKLKEQYNVFMRLNTKGATVEDLLISLIDETRKCAELQSSVESRISALEAQMPNCIQRHALVRYNPFEETGGDLSYVAAFLDKNGSGIILNGLYNRDGSYTYAKEIVNGNSEKHKLSEEEKEALSRALGNIVV